MNITFVSKSNSLFPAVQCGYILFHAERLVSEAGGEKLRIEMNDTIFLAHFLLYYH
jgi:hypothetical protein